MSAASRTVAALVLVVAGCAQPNRTLYSGTVQAPSAAVGSPVGGRVTAVFVRDGDRVRRGQTLVRFDDAQLRATLAAAQHQVAVAEAALADLRAGTRAPDLQRAQDQAQQAREQYESARLSASHQLDALRAQLAQAQAQLADARAEAKDAAADAQRLRALAASGDASTQARDAAVAHAERSRAQVRSGEATVANVSAQLRSASEVTLPRATAAAFAQYSAARNAYASLAAGPRPDAVRRAEAELAAARSAAAVDAARLDDTIVRAPAEGVVTAFDLHVGDLVAPGAAAAIVNERGEPYVRIYVPQSQLGRFAVGQRVDVHPDARPGTTVPGTVEQIDQQAQFTPQNVQTPEDRAELSFGVKVRIHDAQQQVLGGTTVAVTLP